MLKFSLSGYFISDIQKKHNSSQLIFYFIKHISFQEECTKIRKCIKLSIKSYIFITEFNARFDFCSLHLLAVANAFQNGRFAEHNSRSFLLFDHNLSGFDFDCVVLCSSLHNGVLGTSLLSIITFLLSRLSYEQTIVCSFSIRYDFLVS